MQRIFLVLSNLKHSGQIYKKDSFIAGQDGQFTHLVNEGVLREIVGAENETQAAEIVAKEAAAQTEQAEKTVEAAPKDTWGPQPDTETVAPGFEANTGEQVAADPSAGQVNTNTDSGTGQTGGTGNGVVAAGGGDESQNL